ncbi:hypothetical protein RHGRI_000933 [Rhododendron griersonianum]|uniref:Ubiquitin-like protease family profile domain-containing protein n=1 Tax=Rhododendron griersonianum TaxID=479676 RepID=A0AAV6LL96_9ERIC|nr:hypothetical protein RHGRI_000933 [Rhododendron griersonianum]
MMLKRRNGGITTPSDQEEKLILTFKMPSQCVDCGIFVCYIIKRLAEKREIPQTLQPRDVAEFKVHMVRKFLNDDQRTWTEDLWKDNQLANEMEQ